MILPFTHQYGSNFDSLKFRIFNDWDIVYCHGLIIDLLVMEIIGRAVTYIFVVVGMMTEVYTRP